MRKWFTVDKLCLTLAIIYASISLVIVVGCAIVWYMVYMVTDPGISIFLGLQNLHEVFIVAVMPLVAIINVVFLVFLCNGIVQNRPEQVKVYYVYSVVMAVLALAFVVVLTCGPEHLGLHSPYIPDHDMDYKTIACFIVGYVLHISLLGLVHMTYRKLNKARSVEYDDLLKTISLQK